MKTKERTMYALAAFAFAAACDGDGDPAKNRVNGDNDENGGESQPTPTGPRVACADLPGAIRFHLRRAAEGDDLLWIEEATRADPKALPARTIVRFAPGSGQTTEVIANVGDTFIQTPHGIVFNRPTKKREFLEGFEHALYVRDSGGVERRLSPEGMDVGDFEVVEDQGIVYFAGGKYFLHETYSVPLAGGESEKLGDGRVLGRDAANRRLLVGGIGLSWLPEAGGEKEMILEQDPFVFLGEEHLIRVRRSTPRDESPRFYATELSDGNKDMKLDWPTTDYRIYDLGANVLVTGEVGAERRAVVAAGVKAKYDLTIANVELAGFVAKDDSMTVLALQDSDGDGRYLARVDESDVCTVQNTSELGGTHLEFPGRQVPKARLSAVERVTEALTGLGIDVERLRWDYETFTVYARGSGSADLSELRSLVSKARDAIGDAVGNEDIFEIEYLSSGRRAASEWNSLERRHIAAAGIGGNLRTAREDFVVSVDPTVTRYYETDYIGQRKETSFGKAKCSGTLTNIGGETLVGVEVECVNRPRFASLGDVSKRSKLKTRKLRPGASAPYKVRLRGADFEAGFKTVVFVGGTGKTPFNEYADRKAAEGIETNDELVRTSGLVYLGSMTVKDDSRPFSRETKEVALVQATSAFMEKSDADKENAAAAATRILAGAELSSALLRIYEPGSERVGWRFEEGALLEGDG